MGSREGEREGREGGREDKIEGGEKGRQGGQRAEERRLREQRGRGAGEGHLPGPEISQWTRLPAWEWAD